MPNKNSTLMVYAGVHFKTCPIEVREIWSTIADSKIVKKYIDEVTKAKIEFVNIATCNRFDLCFFGEISNEQIHELFYKLANHNLKEKQNNIFLNNKLSLNNYIKIYSDNDAFEKLIKVASSLDSLVIGEQQILGQIKSAFYKSQEQGYSEKIANKVFSQIFRIVKKIRTNTAIGKNSVSIGTASIEMINQVFESLKEKNILIIGAGDMAKLIAKNFSNIENKKINIANRTFDKALALSKLIPNSQALHLNDALENLHKFDVCLTAANGTDYIIDQNILRKFKKNRLGELTVFIDISVPRKIDPTANSIDNLFLFYVDDLEKIMEKNKTLRFQSAQEAQLIIEEEVSKYKEQSEQNKNLIYIAKLHKLLNKSINNEINRYQNEVSRGKKIPSTVIANAVTKKFISNAAKLARENTKLDTSQQNIGSLLDFLFNLSEQEKDIYKNKRKYHHQNNQKIQKTKKLIAIK
jgi:glutamyl-tRNA reductase